MKTRNGSLSRRRLFKKGAAAAASAALITQSGTRLRTGAGGRDRAHVSRMDLARHGPWPHDAAGGPAAPGHRAAGRRPHRAVQPVLLERRRGPRHSAGAARRRCGHTRERRPHRRQHERHGAHPGPRRRGRRRGGRPEVRRVQVGDRVCVSGTPQCGACYHCLRGRADVCQLLGRNLAGDLRRWPICVMALPCTRTRTSAGLPS